MSTETITPKQDVIYPDEGYKEMVDSGVFYGRKKSKTHPRMKQFILTTRNGIEVINLAKTIEMLGNATDFLREKAKAGGVFLFVGTQPPAVGLEDVAKELKTPVVLRRWLGGTLTNFRIISKRIEYFKKLKADWANNAFENYTKKERLMIEREMNRLEELMGGLKDLVSLPDVLVVIDPNIHMAAVREAKQLKIPVVAFANTDSDPDFLDYPVVGNNKARISVNWFLQKIKTAIEEGRKMTPVVVQEVKKESENKNGGTS